MQVRDLIAELEKIEDKTQEVKVRDLRGTVVSAEHIEKYAPLVILIEA